MSDGVETVGGLVVEAVHEVPVAVDGDLDRGVPQSGLDGFGMLTGGDQPGGVGVAQVVDPTGSFNRAGDGLPPDPSERSPPQKPALFAGPDHLIDRWVLPVVASQGFDDHLGEGDGSFGGLRLGGAELGWLTGRLDERGADGEPASQHVHIGDPQTGQFAPTQTGVGGHDGQRPVPFGERFGEGLHFGGVEEPHVGAAYLGEPQPLSGGREDPPVADGLVEGEPHPAHRLGDRLGGIAGGGQLGHHPPQQLGGEPRQRDLPDEGEGALVAAAVGFDSAGTEMDPPGQQLGRVVDPADVPVVGIDPLAPIEFPESGPEPPFGVDLAIEALRMKPPVGSPVAGPPRSRPVGSMLDGTPH